MFSTEPEIGSTANSYTILAKLATGGMAEIFLARTASAANVERYVVLKRVHRHRASDIKFINMFLDEARLAAQLQHPNIAQVFDTGKLGDSYFFTMEYVHGETVRELMHRSFALGQHVPIGCALTIIAGAAAGLQHAHDRVGVDGKHLTIVHRDVSPSNLMVTFEGNVKVVDFGVAKASHRSSETQSGTVKGKIGYMSPEQCRGGNVDRRCDLFCLGIVLWELLVGERLFKRATDFESMEAVVQDTPPAPSSLRPDIPRELDAIVLKLLQKSPDDRYQTADELLEDIENVAVRTGMGISVAALRRYVRDLFGQRPEPWVELRLREARAEVVTVTGAPAVVSDTNLEPIDEQLERVLDLSTSSVVAIPDPASPASSHVREPMRRVGMATGPTASAAALVVPPTRPASGAQAAVERPASGAQPAARPASGAQHPAARPASGALPVARPVSGAQPAARPASGAQPVTARPVSGAQAAARPVVDDDDLTAVAPARSPFEDSAPSLGELPPAPARSLRWLVLVLVFALVTGATIAVLYVLRGETPRASATATSAPVPAPAPASAPAPVPEPEPPVPVATAEPAEPAAGSADPASPSEKPSGDRPKPTHSGTRPARPAATEDIATVYRAGRFGDVVASCSASAKVLAANAVACTLAACRQHDDGKAKRWLASAPASKRSGLVSACGVQGVTLEAAKAAPAEPPPEPKCDDSDDPMACRK